jgi:pseudoazurin
MANKGTLVIVTVAAALVLFIVFAITPFITGSDDNYQLKPKGINSSSVVIDDAVIMTEEIPDAVTDEEASEETDQSIVAEVSDAVSSEMENATEAAGEALDTVQESVEEVVEDVKATVAEVAEVAEVSGEPQVHIVTAQGLVYAPLVVNIAVGDSVAWENMSSHDTQSMEGLIPAGAEHWHSAMGENYQHTFTVEGVYIYKCTPHYGAGMGGVIIVGNPVNIEDIKAQNVKGAGKRLVKKAIKAVEAM